MTNSGKYHSKLQSAIDDLWRKKVSPNESEFVFERREAVFQQLKQKIYQAVSFHKQQSPRRLSRLWAFFAFVVLASSAWLVWWVSIGTGDRSAGVLGKIVKQSNKSIEVKQKKEELGQSFTEEKLTVGNVMPMKKPDSSSISLDFSNGVALGEMFLALEKVYGVKIEVRQPLINDCEMKGDFSNMEIEDILDIICLSVQANYMVKDGRIVIDGQGCKKYQS